MINLAEVKSQIYFLAIQGKFNKPGTVFLIFSLNLTISVILCYAKKQPVRIQLCTLPCCQITKTICAIRSNKVNIRNNKMDSLQNFRLNNCVLIMEHFIISRHFQCLLSHA